MCKGWCFEGDGVVKCDGWDIDFFDDWKWYLIDDNLWKFWFCFVVEVVKVVWGFLWNLFIMVGFRVC